MVKDEYIEHLLNVNNIAQNLFSNELDIFSRFFEKIYNLDKGFLYSFIAFNYSKIGKEQMSYAKSYFEQRGRITDWHIEKKPISDMLKWHAEELKKRKEAKNDSKGGFGYGKYTCI